MTLECSGGLYRYAVAWAVLSATLYLCLAPVSDLFSLHSIRCHDTLTSPSILIPCLGMCQMLFGAAIRCWRTTISLILAHSARIARGANSVIIRGPWSPLDDDSDQRQQHHLRPLQDSAYEVTVRPHIPSMDRCALLTRCMCSCRTTATSMMMRKKTSFTIFFPSPRSTISVANLVDTIRNVPSTQHHQRSGALLRTFNRPSTIVLGDT